MKLRLVADHGEILEDTEDPEESGELSGKPSELVAPVPLRPGDGFEPVPGIPAF